MSVFIIAILFPSVVILAALAARLQCDLKAAKARVGEMEVRVLKAEENWRRRINALTAKLNDLGYNVEPYSEPEKPVYVFTRKGGPELPTRENA